MILELTAEDLDRHAGNPAICFDQFDSTDRRLCVAAFRQVCFAGTHCIIAQVLAQLSLYGYAMFAGRNYSGIATRLRRAIIAT
jgi:hypothetical protein